MPCFGFFGGAGSYSYSHSHLSDNICSSSIQDVELLWPPNLHMQFGHDQTEETNRILWPVLLYVCADLLDRSTTRPAQRLLRGCVSVLLFFVFELNMRLYLPVCVYLRLLCKVHPGVSLSCDVTLQTHSWEG